MNITTSKNETNFDLTSLAITNFTDFSGKPETDSNNEKFVVFTLDGELFGVSVKSVTEVVQPLTITALPNSPAWLYGVANLRGEIISVLNLPKICGKPTASLTAKTKLIIFRPAFFDSPAAFLVDRIAEITGFAVENMNSAEETYFLATAVLNSNPVNLLDTDKIFSSLLA